MVQLSHPYMTNGKTIAFTRRTFVSKAISLLFNILSRLVITFLSRSKCLLISWLQSPSAVILEPKKIKALTVSIVSPSICREVMGPDAMILVFWMLSFKPTFSLSSVPFIKRLFSYSSLSAIRVVSSAYLRLLLFLLAILVPACASSSPAFHMKYSAYKLNKQGDNIQPWCTPFPIWNQSVVPCSVLTIASWPAYRFLRRQVGWSGIPISFRIFQFVVINTVKGFVVVNKAEVDVFQELSCFFNDPADVGNLISGFSAFSKSSLNIWKFTVHVRLKPGLENFEHYFTSVRDECNCVVVWAFCGIAFLWDWNENWLSSPVGTAEFSKFAGILSAALSQHHLLGFEIAQPTYVSLYYLFIFLLSLYQPTGASLVPQMVKDLPAMWETQGSIPEWRRSPQKLSCATYELNKIKFLLKYSAIHTLQEIWVSQVAEW